MSPVNLSMLSRKFCILLLFLSLVACGTPKSNLNLNSLVRVQSGSADKIYTMLEDLASQLPSEEAGIAIGYVEGENITIAFVGNPAFTEETLFEYGSITKVLTANILMQLVNEGSLHLDDRLNEFLPEDIQDQPWEAVTLRHLATHTAGIPFSAPNLSLPWLRLTGRGNDPFASYDEAMLYQGIQATKVRSVGKKWEYSNYGYALLGLVISQQTKVDYASLVEQRIFDPLGMEGATIEGWSSNNIAPPLTLSGISSTNWSFDAFASTGALRGNLLDGISFLKASMSACQSSGIIARSNCQTQQSTDIQIDRTGQNDKTGQMGLGWIRNLNEDNIVIHHFGGTGGYTAFIGFNPGKDVGIVLLNNVAFFQPIIDRAVMDFLLSGQ